MCGTRGKQFIDIALTFRRTRGRSRVGRIVAGSSSVGLLAVTIPHVAQRKALARSHDARDKIVRENIIRARTPISKKKKSQPLLAITSVFYISTNQIYCIFLL